jgi:hypothetical protein
MTEHVQKTFFRETSDKLSEGLSSRSHAAVSKLHVHVAVAVLPPEYVTRSVFSPSNAVFTLLFNGELLLKTYYYLSS